MLPGCEIVKMIGRGGMGAVYMGRQISLDRTVAIKILSSTLEKADADFADRFKNEARSMAKFNHPSIVTVFDFGETDNGMLYIVMEYVDGTDVARMIAADGRLHSEHAMAITAHVCDALAYAHGVGVIHRDIKPANIMVGYDGIVKVADFGLAKAQSDKAESMGLTMSGQIMGTMHYMAPESLILGSTNVDHRADVFAVGVMLYHMLTGKLPHGMFELPSLQVKGLDPRYDDIIAKAMREDREERYQDAHSLRSDLDAILTQPVQEVKASEAADLAREEIPALPTEARPRRSGADPRKQQTGQEVSPPPSPQRSHSSSSSSPLRWIAALSIIAVGAYFVWDALKKEESDTSESISFNEQLPTLKSRETSSVQDDTNMPELPAESEETTEFAEQQPTEDTSETAVSSAAEATISAPVSIDKETAEFVTKPSSVASSSTKSDEGPSVEQEKATSAPRWADLPELTTRLSSYLEFRKAQLGVLAQQYSSGLESRLERSSAEGNLELASALKREKDRIADFGIAIENPDTNPVQAVMSPPALPPLAEDSPLTLRDLRTRWDDEYSTIRDDLDTKLDQSLGILVTKLTQAREFETAENLNEWRSSLYRRDLVYGSSQQDQEIDTESSLLVAATKDAPFTNSLGMKFVPVDGTEVLFCIHETRNRDYEVFVAEKNYQETGWKDFQNEHPPITERRADHPVSRVSWHDANSFSEWLSQKEGLNYRLPTYREWSYAVGIGEEQEKHTRGEEGFQIYGVYPWGKEYPPPFNTANYMKGDDFTRTAPVMSFPPNIFGVYDLGGNNSEWVQDIAWTDEHKQQRILRGHHWGSFGMRQIMSSAFHASAPDRRKDEFGFRVVVEIPGIKGTPNILETRLVGRWNQVNEGKKSPIFSLELFPDGTADFADGPSQTKGICKVENGKLHIELKNGVFYRIEVPATGPVDELSGFMDKIDGSFGKAVPVKLRKVTPQLNTSAGTTNGGRIFDGFSLDGWKLVGDNDSFQVVDEMIMATSAPGKLFFVGENTNRFPELEDFELSLKVKADVKANSGIWIHADPSLNVDNPGLEADIRVDDDDLKRTGAIWLIEPAKGPYIEANEWCDLRLTVKGETVTIHINSELSASWTQPRDWNPTGNFYHRRLGKGTIALQGFGRGPVWFKEIELREL